MKKTALIMGMPSVIEINDARGSSKDIEDIFDYFRYVDNTFSTYKDTSEISRLNSGVVSLEECAGDVIKVLDLCEKTKKQTNGYFDIKRDNKIDPSGLVKGFAILQGARILKSKGYSSFYIDIGSDIQISGRKTKSSKWRVGIRNPFNLSEIIKIIELGTCGIATSGTYIRGKHIYNPLTGKPADEIVSLTVIGKNVYEADRFATAAFAMGRAGIQFIEKTNNMEAYMIIDKTKAMCTSGFGKYVV